MNPATLAITTTTLPNGTQGTVYNQTLTTSGGTGAVTWTLKSGTLPAGLALDFNSGAIGGTPTATGTSNFTVQAMDSGSPQQTATQALSITIGAGASNNTPLNGQYAFVMGDSGDNLMGGTFIADGAGHITNGLLDYNNLHLGVFTNLPITGSCTLSNDLRGTITFNNATIGTYTFALAATVDGTGNSPKGVMSQHDTTVGVRLAGEYKKQDPTAFTLTANAGDYAFGMQGRDGSNIREVVAGDFTLASNGTVSAGEWDHLGGITETDFPFTGTMTAPTTGRGTFNINNSNGTYPFSYFPISSTESFVMGIGTAAGFPLWQGEMLRQSGRPFSGSALSAAMTFSAQADSSPGSSEAARTGTIGPQGTPGTLTMTYTGTSAMSPDVNSGFFTYAISAAGRVVTTDTFTGATSVFYMASANKGFIVGGTVAAADSTKKVFGKFEPQTGGPYSLASLSGDYVYATAPSVIDGGIVRTGIVHFDGVGNATASTDSEDATGTLGTGTVNTWTATQNGTGSPTFLIQTDAGDFWLMTLVSPNKAVFAPMASLTNYPDLYLLEK